MRRESEPAEGGGVGMPRGHATTLSILSPSPPIPETAESEGEREGGSQPLLLLSVSATISPGEAL